MNSLAELRKKSRLLPPIIRIGKNGLTQQQLSEIKKLLEKKKIIKIKMLKSADLSKKEEVIKEVVEKTNSRLVSKIGNTFTIHKY